MAVVLDGDTIEAGRSYAEEERRRQREAETARQAESQRLSDVIKMQQAKAYPGVQVDPYSDTGWSYEGTPVSPDYEPVPKPSWASPESRWALPDIGWNTPSTPSWTSDQAIAHLPDIGWNRPSDPYAPNAPGYVPSWASPDSRAALDTGWGRDMPTSAGGGPLGNDAIAASPWYQQQTAQNARRAQEQAQYDVLGNRLNQSYVSAYTPSTPEEYADIARREALEPPKSHNPEPIKRAWDIIGAPVVDKVAPISQALTDWGAEGFYNFGRDVNNPGYKTITGEEIPTWKNADPITRGAYQVLGDPQNLLGAGVVTKAAKGAKWAGRAGEIVAGANKALDVAQAKAVKPLIMPAIGGVTGYVANEAAGQPLEPYQAIGLGVATGTAAKPVIKGAKALGGELATGRLAGETGAIDFTKRGVDPGTVGALKSANVPIAPDGSVTLYHATTAANADAIRTQGVLRSAGEPDVYFSTSPKIGESYGDGTVVQVRVKAKDLNLDDQFPDGRADFRVAAPKKTYTPLEIPAPDLPQNAGFGASGVTPPPRASDTAYQSHDEWRRGRDAFVKSEIARRAEVAGETVYHASPFEYTGLEARWAELHPEPYVRTKAYHEAHGLPWPPSAAIPSRPVVQGTEQALPNRQVAGSSPAGPTPPPPPRVPTATGATPTPPRKLPTLDEIVHPNERPTTGLIRRYEGAVDTAGLELRQEVDAGNKLLRDAKIPGKWNGSRFEVQRTPEVEQLYKALHGEGTPPASLQGAYDYLKPLVDAETAKTVDFDPAFVPRDDYFYRGWKEVPVGKAQRAGTTKGQVGATPGYMKPRSDQTFSDILGTVYTKADGTQVRLEPVSWNPFEQYGLRKAAGEQHRAQTELLDLLKESGNAVDASMAPEGWRIPRVGPAFEGKPFAYTPGTKTTNAMERLADEAQGAKVGYTTRFAVPDKAANDIEAIFGRAPSLGRVGDAVINVGQKAKQAKLFASLFQQMDFGARTFGSLTGGVIDEVATAVEKAATMHPVQATRHLYQAGKQALNTPVELAKLPMANMSGARQATLRGAVLDAKPLFKERPGITLRGVSENGGKFGTDISMVTRDFMKDVRDAAKNRPAWLTSNVATRRLQQLNAASQRGLFDGWYVQSQTTALKNQIIPRMMRQHPDWTDAQIMGAAADQMNKMFSTLGNYQTFIKNPTIKKLTHALVFSTNESEALLRGAASTVVGPNKRLWTEFYLGTFVSLAAIAETVHYATTGEHLPLERLNPIDTENDFGPLPVGYRTNFLAPDIPLKGRGGTSMTIDTVMQMDTIFRLLDPKAFAMSRENVLPRTIQNQYTGKDFFGRELRGPKERITQAATDLFEPIGAGNLRGAVGIGPQNEARAGKVGQAIQALGPNVRAENNAQLRDRMAGEWATETGATKADGSPIKSWNDLEPNQRTKALDYFPDFKQELTTRRDEGVASGQYEPSATDAIKATYLPMQEALDAELASGAKTASEWRDVRHDNILTAQGEYNQATKGFPTKTEKTPLDRYYEAVDAAKKPTGEMDWDKVDAYEASLSPADQAYIARNTGLGGTETEKRYKAATKAIEDSGWWDLKDKAFQEAVSNGLVKGDVQPQPGQGFYEWQEAVIAKYLPAFVDKYGPEIGPARARQEVSSYKPIKDFSDWYNEKQKPSWVMTHPEEAKLLIKWGYVDTFGKDGDAWLAKQ